MCDHKRAIVEKYPIGCGYYGYCPDCDLVGGYANTKEEAEHNFKEMIKNETMDTRY